MAPDAEIRWSFKFYISDLKLNTWCTIPWRKKSSIKHLEEGFKVTIWSMLCWALTIPENLERLCPLNNRESFWCPFRFLGFRLAKQCTNSLKYLLSMNLFFFFTSSLLTTSDSGYLILYLIKRHSFYDRVFLLFSSKHRVLVCYPL